MGIHCARPAPQLTAEDKFVRYILLQFFRDGNCFLPPVSLLLLLYPLLTRADTKKGGASAPPFFMSVVSGAAELRLRRAACPSASFISNGYEGMMKATAKQTQKTVAIAEEL